MQWMFILLLIVSFGFLGRLFLSVEPINKYDGINLDEARMLAEAAQKDTKFPIVVNSQVLHYLDKHLSRPVGRLQLKACFENMNLYKEIISTKIRNKNLPEELMAIPIIESCYRNIHSENQTGSGIWMLIRATALAKGLKIDALHDDRLNIERSTEVATDYLYSNYKMFKHWHLAILAYNQGEGHLRWAILEKNTRDAWTLEQEKNYLAQVMAVIIIMKNVETLN